MKSRYVIASIAGLGLTLTGIVGAQAYDGESLAAQAKITLPEARNLALKAHPGTITDEELEKEQGGSGLRYSFDIKGTDKVVYEVGVDAHSGAVLENDRESDRPD